MSIFNGDTEKEVSSGAMIGYILVGFAALVVIAFLVFAGIRKVNSNNTDNQAIEQSTEIDNTDAE